jgi:hypothetical protein
MKVSVSDRNGSHAAAQSRGLGSAELASGSPQRTSTTSTKGETPIGNSAPKQPAGEDGGDRRARVDLASTAAALAAAAAFVAQPEEA